MKAYLLDRDHDFDLAGELPRDSANLIADMELETLFDAMTRGDKYLAEIMPKVVLAGIEKPAAIRYRQEILHDCLDHPETVRTLYDLTVEAVDRERRNYFSFARSPSSILYRAVEVLEMFVEMLKKLRQVADIDAEKFTSAGFRTLFAMLQRELDDAYFAEIQAHLRQLRFRGGVLVSARLGQGNRGVAYTLRRALPRKQGLVERLLAQGPPSYSFTLHPRDENGLRALGELRDRGVNLVADALAQSTDHILSFFRMLRLELAFYVGCINLSEELAALGEPIAFPEPAEADERRHNFTGLYDVCLALTKKQRVVGNDVDADGKDLIIVTGANQGGKSTFLRSIGLAQTMMQCGMFVAAEAFAANVATGTFTHYKREEDTTMKSGKFDEELVRMSEIVDALTPNAMVLFNESFSATNEREGSEIGRQIVRALLEKRIKIVFVTHFYDLASGFWDQAMANALFLRADRQPDGSRSFKLALGEPLATSFGADLYRRLTTEKAA